METKLKKFDIEEARKGAKVVTRLGFPVRIIAITTNKIMAVIQRGLLSNQVAEKWNHDGTKFANSEHFTDLFLVA